MASSADSELCAEAEFSEPVLSPELEDWELESELEELLESELLEELLLELDSDELLELEEEEDEISASTWAKLVGSISPSRNSAISALI